MFLFVSCRRCELNRDELLVACLEFNCLLTAGDYICRVNLLDSPPDYGFYGPGEFTNHTYLFADGFTFFHETDGPKWWDVKGKKLLGGKVELPNVRVMTVGIEKTEEGCVVYIMWWET